MQSILFPSRIRNAMAVLVSLLAVAVLAAYLGAPTSAIAAKLTANYKRATRTLVEGVVKSPDGRADRNGEVVLAFRNSHGHLIKRRIARANRKGRFYVVAPVGAKTVVLTVYLHPGRKAPRGTRTFGLVSGKALSLTVVFHRSGGGILPAVFPY
jgi:hypothetical protein